MVDAYVLRSMHRRCNYDRAMVEKAAKRLEIEMIARQLGSPQTVASGKVGYYIEQFERSSVADVVILPYLDQVTVSNLSLDHMQKLMAIVQGMLQYQPFELVTIHDEFQAHPNNLNWVRWQYKEILAELAESNLLDDLLSQLYQTKGYFPKRSKDLASKIRKSNYGLC